MWAIEVPKILDSLCISIIKVSVLITLLTYEFLGARKQLGLRPGSCSRCLLCYLLFLVIFLYIAFYLRQQMQ